MTNPHSPNFYKKSLREKNQKKLTLTPLIIRALFRNVTGNEASLRYIRNAKESKMISEKDQSFTYGEVEVKSFINILGYTSPPTEIDEHEGFARGRIFYDLGCGLGRAVITAALSPSPFTKVVGIELIPELYESSVEVKACLLSTIREVREEMQKMEASNASKAGRNSTVINSIPALKQKKDVTLLSESQLVDKIKYIIIKKEFNATLEFIGNELTKQLGHKIYKSSMQIFGKFSRFIENNKGHFLLESDGSVSLVAADLSIIAADTSIFVENYEYKTNIDQKELSLFYPDITLCNISNSSSEKEIGENNNSPTDSDVICETSSSTNNDHRISNDFSSSCNSIITMTAEEMIDNEKILHLKRQNDKLNALKAALTSYSGSLEAIFPLPEIDYIQGDIFEQKWYEDADVVYVSSLLFSDQMMDNLTAQALRMKKGSWLISLKPLKLSTECHDKIVLRQKSFHKMSWNMAEVFIYQLSL